MKFLYNQTFQHFYFFKGNMDAERINQIEAKISDLTARLVELRGYL